MCFYNISPSFQEPESLWESHSSRSYIQTISSSTQQEGNSAAAHNFPYFNASDSGESHGDASLCETLSRHHLPLGIIPIEKLDTLLAQKGVKLIYMCLFPSLSDSIRLGLNVIKFRYTPFIFLMASFHFARP